MTGIDNPTLLSDEDRAAVVEAMTCAIYDDAFTDEHVDEGEVSMAYCRSAAVAALTAALPIIERCLAGRFDTDAARLAVARAIGQTAGIPNHIERARQVLATLAEEVVAR